jgi:hypothetical protein
MAPPNWLLVLSRPSAGRREQVKVSEAGPARGMYQRMSCQRTGIGEPGRLCGVAVFVDEAAEAVDSFDLPDGAGAGRRSVCR